MRFQSPSFASSGSSQNRGTGASHRHRRTPFKDVFRHTGASFSCPFIGSCSSECVSISFLAHPQVFGPRSRAAVQLPLNFPFLDFDRDQAGSTRTCRRYFNCLYRASSTNFKVNFFATTLVQTPRRQFCVLVDLRELFQKVSEQLNTMYRDKPIRNAIILYAVYALYLGGVLQAFIRHQCASDFGQRKTTI